MKWQDLKPGQLINTKQTVRQILPDKIVSMTPTSDDNILHITFERYGEAFVVADGEINETTSDDLRQNAINVEFREFEITGVVKGRQ